ncbi:hypothetical protein LCGC14_1563850 [marine sediment metagenome]|uniref:Uncharacterized protein n=1 Tax=marine sediment metagenome TaxID=412755 RepID=A0A0F9ILP7_9ZZZZ
MDAVVIGMGSAGKRHATNLMALSQKIVAVAEPTWEDQVAKGIRVFRDPLECLEKESNGRLVIIASPTAFHYEQVVKAVDNGAAAVLVEKPMAVNADQAWEMWRNSETMGVRAAVGFNFRFMTQAVQLVAGPIVSGEQPIVFQSVAIDDMTKWPSYHPKTHFLDPGSGGVLLTSTIHAIDMSVGLLGKPTSVFGLLGRDQQGLDVNSTLIVGFDGGFRAMLVDVWEEGREPFTMWTTHAGMSFAFADLRASGWKSEIDGMHYRMLKSFIQYGEDDRERLCNFEQGYWGMAVLDAARRSAEAGSVAVDLTLQAVS